MDEYYPWCKSHNNCYCRRPDRHVNRASGAQAEAMSTSLAENKQGVRLRLHLRIPCQRRRWSDQDIRHSGCLVGGSGTPVHRSYYCPRMLNSDTEAQKTMGPLGRVLGRKQLVALR